jgi:hypothetical protein
VLARLFYGRRQTPRERQPPRIEVIEGAYEIVEDPREPRGRAWRPR